MFSKGEAQYTFPRAVFSPESSQQDVYDGVAPRMVEGFTQRNGYNADSEIMTFDRARKASTAVQKRTYFKAWGSTRGTQVTTQDFVVPTNLVQIAIGPGTYT